MARYLACKVVDKIRANEIKILQCMIAQIRLMKSDFQSIGCNTKKMVPISIVHSRSTYYFGFDARMYVVESKGYKDLLIQLYSHKILDGEFIGTQGELEKARVLAFRKYRETFITALTNVSFLFKIELKEEWSNLFGTPGIFIVILSFFNFPDMAYKFGDKPEDMERSTSLLYNIFYGFANFWPNYPFTRLAKLFGGKTNTGKKQKLIKEINIFRENSCIFFDNYSAKVRLLNTCVKTLDSFNETIKNLKKIESSLRDKSNWKPNRRVMNVFKYINKFKDCFAFIMKCFYEDLSKGKGTMKIDNEVKVDTIIFMYNEIMMRVCEHLKNYRDTRSLQANRLKEEVRKRYKVIETIGTTKTTKGLEKTISNTIWYINRLENIKPVAPSHQAVMRI